MCAFSLPLSLAVTLYIFVSLPTPKWPPLSIKTWDSSNAALKNRSPCLFGPGLHRFLHIRIHLKYQGRQKRLHSSPLYLNVTLSCKTLVAVWQHQGDFWQLEENVHWAERSQKTALQGKRCGTKNHKDQISFSSVQGWNVPKHFCRILRYFQISFHLMHFIFSCIRAIWSSFPVQKAPHVSFFYICGNLMDHSFLYG